MMPALDWLQLGADQLANTSPSFFYWGSGALSNILDNAPTCLGYVLKYTIPYMGPPLLLVWWGCFRSCLRMQKHPPRRRTD